MGNYKEWISTLDINIDYYAAFIKAWIAFNSWYREVYGTNLNDGAVIEKIKTEYNTFKTTLTNLLEALDQEGITFRENVGKLHIALESSTIMTQERTKERVPISFSSIAVVNSNNKVSGVRVWYDIITIERQKAMIKTQIKKSKTGDLIFEFAQEKYDVDELTMNPQFVVLRQDTQRKCVESYSSVSPYLIESVLTTGALPSIDCSGVKLVKDTTKVSRAIVDILYLLRCSLMHGDVAPNQVNMQAYKNAYDILSTVLKKLL